MKEYSYTIHGSGLCDVNETMKQFKNFFPSTLDQYPGYLKELHDIIEAHLITDNNKIDLLSIASYSYWLGLIHAGKGIEASYENSNK